jgi:AhpC/TSA family
LEAANTDEEKEKVFSEKYPKAANWFPRLLDVAKSDAEEPVAVNALLWIVQHGSQSAAGKEALDLLSQNHLQSPELKRAFAPLARTSGRAGEEFMRKAISSSPHVEVQAHASYSLSQLLKQRADVAALFADKGNEQLQKNLEKRYDAAERTAFASLDPVAVGKEVVQLLERVKEQTAGTKWGEKLGDSAKGDLFEIRNLAIGMTAPEIEGEDLDGKALKLSDFRGKVVVLDFWGHW